MRYSPESLLAFIEAVDCGSFSAAARKLRKSQSTISVAIANLEADLGLKLFSREARQPTLTHSGRLVLPYVREILTASERLDELAVRLVNQTETRLSVVLSDAWQGERYESLLKRLAERYPDIEFESLFAEDDDVIDLIQTGRAQIGVLSVQTAYPADIATARLPEQVEMAVFVSRDHPLAEAGKVSVGRLATIRQLRLNTFKDQYPADAVGPTWFAPAYLQLLEMAEQGFGWSVLPRWFVAHFGRDKLVELTIEGWPKTVSLDVVWSRMTPPGPAGRWMIDRLLNLASTVD